MNMPVQGVIPHLVVDNASAAIDFYRHAFGATELMRMPAEDGKRLMHAEIEVNGSQVMLMDEFPEYAGKMCRMDFSPKTVGGTSVSLHLSVADCDAAIARAEKAGAMVTMAAHDAFWGDRYGQIVDPFGHPWSFSHPLAGKAG